MKKIAVISALLIASGLAHAEKYQLDSAHFKVGFEVPHLMISTVEGRFNKFDGTFNYDAKKNEVTAVNVTVQTDSIDTNQPKRDDHLRSPDFFNSAKYPEMTFTAKNFAIKPGETKTVKGKLKILKTTKDVDLKVSFKGIIKDPMNTQKAVFDAETEVNRKDFGLKWNKALDGGGVVVGDTVKIKLGGEANMVAEANEKK